MGEEEGAMSSLAIGVAGIMTSILLPVFMRWVLPL
jgi:putative effector of murein hydrolase